LNFSNNYKTSLFLSDQPMPVALYQPTRPDPPIFPCFTQRVPDRPPPLRPCRCWTPHHLPCRACADRPLFPLLHVEAASPPSFFSFSQVSLCPCETTDAPFRILPPARHSSIRKLPTGENMLPHILLISFGHQKMLHLPRIPCTIVAASCYGELMLRVLWCTSLDTSPPLHPPPSRRATPETPRCIGASPPAWNIVEPPTIAAFTLPHRLGEPYHSPPCPVCPPYHGGSRVVGAIAPIPPVRRRRPQRHMSPGHGDDVMCALWAGQATLVIGPGQQH
jgi:hypothetical protein